MPLALTTDDLARLEAASRLLVSPLQAPDPAAWLQEAGRHVRDLVRADAVVTLAPGGTRPFASEEAPDVAAGAMDYVTEVTLDGHRFSDPVVDLWHKLRRRANMEAFTYDLNHRMVSAHGYGVQDAPIVAEVLGGRGFRDFSGILKTTPEGDTMIWALHHTRRPSPFGEAALPLVQALVPSFLAGLDALRRLHAHRGALDTLAEPLAVFDVDGREVHRNPALVALLAGDPERERLEGTLRTLARGLRRLAFATRGERMIGLAGPPPAEQAVATARGTYTLRGTLLAAGAFGPDEACLISMQATVAPAPPSPDEVRLRFGLTAREAEVALLLAEGLRNDEIAERLFIAPGTARRHTEGVLAKLDVSSRAAVAARLLQPA
jgi:DNA-binding CsgD family transcriptional regulator